MELLIPGLILVALMVYASTRIKKITAQAFEAETIETDEFSIQKPDGFLHNLNGDPKYIFEAYSKEYSKANDKLRVGTATIIRLENTSIDAVVDELSQTGIITDEGTEILDETAYRMLVSRGDEKEISYKLAERNGSVYKLEITAMEESRNEPWAETFFDSFRVK